MDASLIPVSLPTRGSFVARTAARIAPLLLIGGVAAYLLARESGIGTATARGFSEAIPLNVSSPIAGRLTEVMVKVGQEVKAGTVVAQLDTRVLDLELRRAQAERKLLEAELIAETSREDWDVTKAEDRRLRTAATSQQDQAALASLDKELERLNGLLEAQLVKASDVEPRRRERDAVAARINTFDQARAAGRAGLAAKSDGKVNQHRAVVQLRTAPLREELRVKDEELAQIALKLSFLTLRAPGDGVVSIINRRAGEVVTAGEAAVVIVFHRPGIFTIYIPERQARRPNVGDPVVISRRGVLTRSATGRIFEVSPEITELPMRLRASPQVPTWGRRILVDASGSETMREVPPGEEIRVRI